ncbi:hypothetical protein H0H92_003908 [Tricholoma furcatifolium]|nr:hypothetical protein H0H92_003908 [Tricholoma furcatifolium]
MASNFYVTFLGTSSGGGPTESRNCSSLICEVTKNKSLWSAPQGFLLALLYPSLVDCAEGTTRQFALQDRMQMALKASNVSKIFFTHMHADHIMGVVPFLRYILYPPPIDASDAPRITRPPIVEIYGPSGIRNFVRQNMKMTLSKTAHYYVVHELLTKDDPMTPCLPHDDSINSLYLPDVMHCNEVVGQDIVCGDDGLWRQFTTSNGFYGDICVDAGPILHRDPCVGYVIREQAGPMRKLVILGDTYDPSAIIPLCLSPSPSLLIHEATDAHIPPHVDYKSRRSPETVLETALGRGHSIPAMAGIFAKTIGAERLVLNHIGSRFPAPRFEGDHRSAVMSEIERQATEAWGSKRRATAAYDYMTVKIPPTISNITSNGNVAIGSIEPELASSHSAMTSVGSSETMQLHYADPIGGFQSVAKHHDRKHRHRGRDGNKDRKRRP